MITRLAAALALLGLFSHQHAPTTSTYALGEWRAEVHHDDFTRTTRCSIVNDYGRFPGVSAQSNALDLRLSPGADSSDAWFSVDGAPAQPWRDVEAALIKNGAMARAEALDNETGGQLPLPYSMVKGAQTISIRLSPRGKIRAYNLRGLWPMMASINRLGCGYPVKGEM